LLSQLVAAGASLSPLFMGEFVTPKLDCRGCAVLCVDFTACFCHICCMTICSILVGY
jgi:hypothetical protein